MNIPRVLVLVCIAVASAQPRSTPERMRGPRIDAPPAQEPQKWSLSPTPLTSIGGGSGASEMLTRVVTVRRLSDGRILLWEPRPASVRLFNTDGRFSRVFAREGGGPGEVRDAIWIGAVKDTILVFDRTQQRLTRFDSTGRVLSTAPLRIAGGAVAYSVIGRWPRGSFLLRSSDPGYSGRGVSGVRRDSTWVAVADSAGQIVQRLFRVPGAASFTKRLSGGGAYVAQQPFGASGLVAVGGRTVWVGDNATPSIVQYDARGRAIQRVTVPFRSLSVDRNSWKHSDVTSLRPPGARPCAPSSTRSMLPPPRPHHTTAGSRLRRMETCGSPVLRSTTRPLRTSSCSRTRALSVPPCDCRPDFE